MWIFDGIIADKQTTTNTQTDEDVLIINDSVDDWLIISDMSSSDIPNSAITFFEEPTEVKILDDTITESDLFWGDVITKEWTTEELAVVDTDSIKTEWNETSFGNIDTSSIIAQTNTTAIVWNPNEVLVGAISSLEGFLAWHEESIGIKMNTIETKQEEITNLKEDIKILNEEARIIAEEKMKVEKMIELFKSQKI